MECSNYQYYVKSLNECFSCQELCNNRKSRGNSLTSCIQACPEYYQHFMIKYTTQSTTEISSPEQTHGNDGNNGTDTFLRIVLPCIAFILLITSITIIIICLKRRRRRRMPIQETGENGQNIVYSAITAESTDVHVDPKCQGESDSGIDSESSAVELDCAADAESSTQTGQTNIV